MTKVKNIQSLRMQEQKEREENAKKEVNDALDKAIMDLQNSKWGDVCVNEETKVLPFWLVELFNKAVMGISNDHLQIMPQYIFGISGKKPSEVTFGEMTIVINVFAKAVPSTFSNSIKDYEEKRMALDRIAISYKNIEFQKEKDFKALQERLLKQYDRFWVKNVN